MSTLDAPMQPPESFSAEEFDDFARRWLEGRNFVVKPAAGFAEFTPKELRALTSLSYEAISKRLRHPHCPPFRAYRGPTGRMVRVLMSPALRAWLCRPKQQGRRSAGPVLPLV